MARPSAYSRGRRIVMQVTMFFVFLATLGLATLVERARAKAVSVELEAKPLLTEHLGIRLPKGWEPPVQESFELPIEVVSREKSGGSQPGRRVVTVLQVAQPSADARELLFRTVKHADALGDLDSFTILGEVGVVATFDIGDPDSDQGWGPTRALPGWYAAAVLPNKGPGGGDLGVIIAVQGLSTEGPAGRHLVRQIADGLTLRHRVAAPRPAPASADDRPNGNDNDKP